MTNALRRYVFFVVVALFCIGGVLAVGIVPAAGKWRGALASNPGGSVVRLPGGAPARAVKGGPRGQLPNIAPLAQVTVSSYDGASADSAAVADGVVDSRGWTGRSDGDGAWVALEWARPAIITEIDLFYAPHSEEASGALIFDDGSTVPVGALPTDGAPWRVRFPAKAARWVMFRVDSPQGTTAGLGEFMVFGALKP
jgi:hypothetical protein